MADLSAVYNRLNGVSQYHPFSANTFADWASEAGDTVKISREGTEYSAPVHKQSLVWRGKHAISMESTGTKERTAIERVSNTKETTTSSGVSSARSVTGGAGSAIKALQYDFYDPEGKYESQLYMDEQRFTTIFAKTGIDGLPAGTSLSTMINQNAQAISLEAIRAYEQETLLSGRITVEANRITQEVTNRENKDNELQGKITVEANRITQEVTDRRGDVEALSGRIIVQANRITQEVTDRTNSDSALSGRITVEAGRISQIVSAVGADGEVNAASIVLAINNAGESEAHIDAGKVYIGNEKSTTVINGKLNASDVTAEYLAAKIANIPTLRGIAASFSGNVSTTSGVIAYQVYADGNNISNPVMATRVSAPVNNVYTLQYMTADGTWSDAGTFSRATTLSGAWSGNKYTVTASPQGNTISDTIAMLTQGNGSTSFSVSACHTSAVAANEVARQNLYLTEDVTAKRVYAREGSSSGTAYGGISTQATYKAGYDVGYDVGYDDGYDDGGGGGASIGDVSIEAIAVSTYQPSGYEGAVLLTELPNAIKNNHRTYVWFKVRVRDTDNQQIYSKYYYCASAD